ncbi:MULTISPECIES: AraC family transcriptional regulator [unclassified Nocardia]|uniref:AraC family transcriptional regulator n=1 Tax=unclassified Nocardia TaxID=2637762 RepID=UPI0033AAA1A8
MGALLMTRLGQEHGLSVDACLRDSGISETQLADPAGEVRAAEELAVVSNIVRELGSPPGLGITAGRRFRLTSYGLWGFALISSPTLRSAIRVGFQFAELSFSLSETSTRETDTELQLVLEPLGIPPHLQRFTIERDLAGIQTLHRDLLAAPTTLARVSLAFPAPPAEVLPVYEDIFGLRPEFDAAENIIAFDGGLADEPLPQANEQTAAIALQHCRDLLDRRRARTGISGQVRDALLDNLTDLPDAAAIAATLNMSERTLRHHLAQEGTSYRALLDEIRERLAEELLVSHGLPVAEIAHRLGYLEVSSFSQAFRRWKGMGPRAFRQLQPT